MRRLSAVIAVLVIALVALAVWVARTGTSQTGTTAATGNAEETAYDYEARDVVVRQMGANGTLQYQLEAKHMSQLPRNGQISATDLTIHYDPAGTEPGGKNRWTLTADSADLPDDGSVLNLNGNVRARGLPPEESAPALLTTDKLTYNMRTQELTGNTPTVLTWGDRKKLTASQLRYNMKTQDLSSDAEVVFTWGRGNTLRGPGLRANIKRDEVALQSTAHATFQP